MKYDTIIIGGGLSGLTCGINLQQKGKKVMVISGGQSSLHFNSGSFDLLGYQDGAVVANPFDAIKRLPETHPYHHVKDMEAAAEAARKLLTEAGIETVDADGKTSGVCTRNHFRLSPIGKLIPAWLTQKGMFTVNDPKELEGKKICVMNITGFLDLPVAFVAENLKSYGADITVKTFTTPLLEKARRSPSEMRATNIAKYLSDDHHIEEVGAAIKEAVPQACDLMLLPAVLGMGNDHTSNQLIQQLSVPTSFIATLPPSVPGTRVQTLLRQRFQHLGGVLLPNNTVNEASWNQNHLESVRTEELEETTLAADEFILATGSFLGGGLHSDYEGVSESIFHLDVDASQERKDWTAGQLFDRQPYQSFGVRTTPDLKVLKESKPIDNVRAIGSILSGNDPRQQDATGIDLLTALTL
ncbi:anaerobic glycerol-3-phosphate dehydrogenase subunit GlpB [Prevotella sp. AGR2160]|uniref:anaerobic glycerol-3-phosphate dehydrogenase subunit GlpB n=1 Tax=Prevotella sp. AGR2160 TaxID=1280674 RepID=UPI0004005F01|nr:anaerobic glycerol-3-phosphate dehydrogenase subunit GlpB [Prevotella sp. AGR2160]